MPIIGGPLEGCWNGYHLCREQDLVFWLGRTIYLAQYRGEVLECADKIVVREARLLRRLTTWNARTARLFAADCAEHVLPIYEHYYPRDDRVRTAILTARRFAMRRATQADLGVVQAAVWTAVTEARSAAGLAAIAAARATLSPSSFVTAKFVAEAAQEAARSAAGGDATAAWETERNWQTARLMTYLFPKAA